MNRTLLMVAAALLIGGFAAFYLYQEQFRADEAGGPMIEVLSASIDIPLGTPVRAEWLTTKEIPQSYVDERHLPASAARDLIGFPLAQSVHADEAILRTDLSSLSDARRTLSGTIPNGARAVTVSVTATSTFGGLLRPGDRVDVLLTIGSRDLPSTWRQVVVLENLLVLAVGQEFELREANAAEAPATGASGTGSPREDRQLRFGRASNITLQVTIEQGQILTLARQQGRMSLLLRNPNDLQVAEQHPDLYAPDIFDGARRARFLRRMTVVAPPVAPVDPAAAVAPADGPVVAPAPVSP